MVRGNFVEVAAAPRRTARSTRRDPEYIAQALFGLLPGFMLQRLILGDVTPDSYSAGLRAILR